ncbi:hypothetical protein J1P26_05635 [Neobacillus sp. MM2021_6]|uniref:hypothetical protein n=1 Tax=Bacillaceae TaxID=186817 RepID=UPI00140AD77F|nr:MULTISPECIES: hypothetical protein [Bacillaceae]MBO0959208.1 hypothetical protein [Neobacillus sp. MM2021_6]NHC16873.1 hypothetical protein [Bacillus sp. MM2020_4]
MYLALSDVAGLIPDKQGIQDEMVFHTITDHANTSQPKGLFVAINKESGDLLEAIANGAIAAIWDQEEKLPGYTPTYFPVFFTTDMAWAVKEILTHYYEKLDGESIKHMEITNFIFSNKKLLNKNKQSYDIAGILEKLTNKRSNDAGRRG